MTDVPIAPGSEAQARYMGQVCAAIGAGDIARAGLVAEQALAEGGSDPLLYKMRALRHEGRGQLEAAAADFRSALQTTPDDAGALNALGLCLARLGRPAEAAPHLERALDLMPGFSGAAFNLGWAYESMGELARARAGYERALEIDSANFPALSSLASLAARAGDFEVARELAGKALAVQPRDATAALALAIADNGEGRHADAQARLEALLADPALLTPHAQAVAEGLLADALDGQGRIAEAFAAYGAENDRHRRLHAGRFGVGGGESGAEYVRRLSDYMKGSTAEEWRDPGAASAVPSPASRHVFLMGFPRSGTTLLGQVLGAHPQIETLDEKETLISAVQAFMVVPEDLAKLRGQTGEALDRYRDLYWRKVRELGAEPEGKVFVDKLPMNLLKLPLIARLFPDATILLARRDPRDVVLSCFRRHFVVNPTTWEFLTLGGAAHHYDAVMKLVEVMDDRLPLELKVQRHEDLVADFDGVSKRLCETLGLDHDPAMAAFAERSRARDIATPSAGQVAAGLSQEGVGVWKRYAVQMAPVLPALQPWVEKFGYAAD
jgi:Tfp pilus assembly protein PilF